MSKSVEYVKALHEREYLDVWDKFAAAALSGYAARADIEIDVPASAANSACRLMELRANMEIPG